MAFQLVYTSIRSGLVAGRSGFCTAARHKELKESIVSRIEDFANQYDRSLFDGQNVDSLPVIYQHRIISIRDMTYHVLMRLGDAGNDYSGRTNHIAHAFILEASEVSGLKVSPAEVVLSLTTAGRWLEKYDESAKYFGPEDTVSFHTFPAIAALPAQTWKNETGAAGNAAWLFDDEGPQSALFATTAAPDKSPERLLKLFSESLLLNSRDRSDPSALWSVPFTTLLQSSSERRQFTWFGCLNDSGLFNKTKLTSHVTIGFERNISPPTGALADYADGREPQPTTSPIERLPESAVPATPSSLPVGATSSTFEANSTVSSEVSKNSVPPPPNFSIPPNENTPKEARVHGKKSRLSLILAITSVTLLAFSAAGIAVWKTLNNDVRAEEKRIAVLIENRNWEEFLIAFEPGGSVGTMLSEGQLSAELEEAQIFADAFKKIEKISSRPDLTEEVVSNVNNPELALGTIRKSINSKDPQNQQLIAELNAQILAAKEKIKKWRDLINRSANITADIGRNIKWGDTKEELLDLIKDVDSHLSVLEAYKTDPANELTKRAEVLETTLVYLKQYKKLKFENPSNQLEQIEAADSEVAKTLMRLKDSPSKDAPEFRKLVAYFGDLKKELEHAQEIEKEKLASKTASPETPSDSAQQGQDQEATPFRTVLVPISAASSKLIPLGKVRESYPGKLSIQPIKNLTGSPSGKEKTLELIGARYYFAGDEVFEVHDESLNITGNSWLSDEFGPDYILQFPEERWVVFRPREQPLFHEFKAKILERTSENIFSFSPKTKVLLESIQVENSEFQIEQSSSEEEPFKFSDPSKFTFNRIEEINKKIQKYEDQIAKANSRADLNKFIQDADFAHAGAALWPKYFKEPGLQHLNIRKNETGKYIVWEAPSPRGIMGQKPLRSLKDFESASNLESASKQAYFNYIKNNLEPLKELAKESEKLEEVSAQLTKIANANEANFQIFKTLTEESLRKKWANTEIPSRSVERKNAQGKTIAVGAETRVLADKLLEKHKAAQYFRDFFTEWNRLFSVENCEKLERFFSEKEHFDIVQLKSAVESEKRKRDSPQEPKVRVSILFNGRTVLLLAN